MKINDLRIMNHVKCSISNDAAFYQILVIDALNDKCRLSGARSDEWISIEKILPIKLTTEFMGELEFNRKDNNVGWDTYTKGIINLSIVPVKTNDLLLAYKVNDEYRYIRYIHELENLYFALTGVEAYLKND